MSVIIGTKQDRTIEGALRALAGEPTTMSPGAALGLLAEQAAAATDSPATQKAIRGLVNALTSHPDPQVRVGAATALGAVSRPVSIRALRAVIDETDDGQLLAAASYALSRVGSSRDVDRLLGGSRRSHWELGQRRSDAAATMLAYRTGKSHPEEVGGDGAFPPVREVLSRPVRGVKITLVDPSDVTSKVQLRKTEANLLPEGAKVVGAFSCGPRQHVVMAPTTRKHLAGLAAAPGVAAALLGVNESTGVAFVRWIVLTRPATSADGRGRGNLGDLVVTVVRPTGEVGFVGRAQVEGDEARVEVGAVAAPGASAVELVVSLAGGKIAVQGTSDKLVTVARNQPIPSSPFDRNR